MAYKDVMMLDDEEVRQATGFLKRVVVILAFYSCNCFISCLGQMFHCYKKCKDIGAIAQVHAENGTLIAEVITY